MTELLEHAFQTLRGLSSDMQDDLARMVLQVVGEGQPVIHLSETEAASFDLSLAQEDAGDFAADAQVDAIWAKHGL